MSVKSLTVVADDDGRDLCVLSRNIDGHLTGHGVDLRDFLRGYIITRQPKTADKRKTVSTIGWLAVTLITEFKTGMGDFELLPSGTRDTGEEYIYTVYARHTSRKLPSLLNLRVEVTYPRYAEINPNNDSKTTIIYDGLLDEFDPPEVQAQWSQGQDELNHSADTRVAQTRAAQVGTHKTQ